MSVLIFINCSQDLFGVGENEWQRLAGETSGKDLQEKRVEGTWMICFLTVISKPFIHNIPFLVSIGRRIDLD